MKNFSKMALLLARLVSSHFGKSPKILIFLTIVFSTSYSSSAAAGRQICYFTLNNQKEFLVTKEYFQTQKNHPSSYTVKELLLEGEYPDRSLLKAIRENIECDALVLSGHHRKSGFEGQLVPGSLPLHIVQELSCNPSTKEWFRKIKVLWLQGCATNENYSKLFPNAVIFSWSGSAPSKIAHQTIPMQLNESTEKNIENLFTHKNLTPFIDSWISFRSWNPSATFQLPYFSEKLSANFVEKEEQINTLCTLGNFYKENSAPEMNANHFRMIIADTQKQPNNLWAQIKYWNKILSENKIEESSQLQLLKIAKQLFLNNLHKKKISLDKKILLFQLIQNLNDRSLVTASKFLEQESLKALSTHLKKKDEVERRGYYSKLISALLFESSNTEPMLTKKILINLKNNEALENILRVLITRHPKNYEVYLLAIAKNPNISSIIRRNIAWHVRAYHPSNSSQIYTVIKQNTASANKVNTLIHAE